MSRSKQIVVQKKTKEELDNIKLCPSETYNNVLLRLLKLKENGT